jgi:hypothetical protein
MTKAIKVFLLCGVLFMPLFILQPIVLSANKPVDVTLSCEEAPPPDFLNITGLTSTSVTVEWGYNFPPSEPRFYEVEIYDFTDGTTVITEQVGNNTTYTKTGLSSGHHFLLSVVASTCETGDFGEPIYIEFWTPDIIVDDVTQNSNNDFGPSQLLYGDYQIPILPSDPSQVQVKTFMVVSNIDNSTFSIYSLWMKCDNSMYLQQEDWAEVIRDPAFNIQGVDVPQVVYYNENTGQPMITVYSPEIDLYGNFVVPVTYHEPVIQSISVINDGIYYPCDEGEGGGGTKGESFRSVQTHSTNNLQSADRTTTPTALASPSPNPFSDHLQVSYRLEEESPVTMQMLNATGQVVREWNSGQRITAGEHTLSLNTADLPSGTYFLLIRSTDKQEQHLVIKQD